jgi:hypothetical protein
VISKPDNLAIIKGSVIRDLYYNTRSHTKFCITDFGKLPACGCGFVIPWVSVGCFLWRSTTVLTLPKLARVP